MNRKQNKTPPLSLLALGAMGVVFGDIGTSPLYALQTAFSSVGRNLPLNRTNILGVISLIVWALILAVTIKFVFFILHTDNEGEGGILALVALVRNSPYLKKRKAFLIMLGIIGVSLFYGDAVITPAISVLSAVEGLNVVYPNLQSLILPITIALLVLLFWLQKFGTGAIGRLFGPVMFVWFSAIGLAGLGQIVKYPSALRALSPVSGAYFIGQHPLLAFLSLTAVVLAITGAEALYADLGHFGRRAISTSWLSIVLPALLLCYVGQGALLLRSNSLKSVNLVLSFPAPLQVPFVILATIATLIASQAVISGAFSLTRQAIQLNLLPKMQIRYTSFISGQIYLPLMNIILFICVIALVVIFGSAVKLANAFGIAVSGTLLTDTILFLAVHWHRLRRSWLKYSPFLIIILPMDILFLTANTTKIVHGGYYPVIFGMVALTLITTWSKGEKLITAERRRLEGQLETFVHKIHDAAFNLRRVPGAAVFIGHHPSYVPLSLHATVEKMHELPEKVVIMTVQNTNAAHIPAKARCEYDDLIYEHDGISHLTLSYGFHDSIHVPTALHEAQPLSTELSFQLEEVVYVISSLRIAITKRRHMAQWRKHLYVAMARNAGSIREYYHLPINQVEEIDTLLEL